MNRCDWSEVENGPRSLCEMCEVVAGRIAVLRVYYDQMAFAGQMGLLPEPAMAG